MEFRQQQLGGGISCIANPFTFDYYNQEHSAYAGKPLEVSIGNVSIKYFSRPPGLFYDYLHHVEWKEIRGIPYLFIDGNVVMTLEPAEVQSHAVPVHLAHGRVGVGGLGLGYYARRILENPAVQSVTVYERNPHVIDLFRERYGQIDRLRVIQQDVTTVAGETFDYFYCDVTDMFAVQEIPIMKTLCAANSIGEYHFWCLESWALGISLLGYELPEEWGNRFSRDFWKHLSSLGNRINLHSTSHVQRVLDAFLTQGVLALNNHRYLSLQL